MCAQRRGRSPATRSLVYRTQPVGAPASREMRLRCIIKSCNCPVPKLPLADFRKARAMRWTIVKPRAFNRRRCATPAVARASRALSPQMHWAVRLTALAGAGAPLVAMMVHKTTTGPPSQMEKSADRFRAWHPLVCVQEVC